MIYKKISSIFVFGVLMVIYGLVSNNSSNKNITATRVQQAPTPTKIIASPSATVTPQQILGEEVKPELFLVERVVDGDTIELSNGQKVRYIGINTPETVDPRKKVQCFGKEASNKNKELVEGKMVRLEKDVSETDRYGRLLRYVYVEDLFVNDYLVKQGFAYASSFPPDVAYQSQFSNSQNYARANNLGLWSSCQ